ncbi:hypothetical protein [Priestia megaterium]|uniref:hypothetical protein n=1 Tax=Priestia megaterium TaxID=1404 RepID=UPI001374ABFD|nr:hypothetical protein [Priestia megaterium]
MSENSNTLYNYNAESPDEFRYHRLLTVSRYCDVEGFAAGFPLFYHNPSKVFGQKLQIIKIKDYVVDRREFTEKDYSRQPGRLNLDVVSHIIREGNALIQRRSLDFAGAIPTFEKVTVDGEMRITVNFLKKDFCDKVTIDRETIKELGYPPPLMEKERWHAVNKYNEVKLGNKYEAGFPTFNDEDNGPVEAIFIKKGHCEREEIPIIHESVQSYFYEGFARNRDFELFIKRSFNEVVRRLENKTTEYLEPDEVQALIDKGLKRILTIRPYTGTRLINAEAHPDINEIHYREAAFPPGSLATTPTPSAQYIDLCRSTIHELMHMGGGKHDVVNKSLPHFMDAAGLGCKRNIVMDCAHNPTGHLEILPEAAKYYLTSPLRAECYIDGNQT